MKALTICQPYAHLIVVGDKRVENREWQTRYRGPLLIHAGKSRDWLTTDAAVPNLVFGAAVGIVDLVDCLHIDTIHDGLHDDRYPWLRGHRHTNGTWCLILDNVRRFETPLPWKGAQGFWNFPDAMLPTASAHVSSRDGVLA